MRRQGRVAAIVLLAVGAVMFLIALCVFLTQGSQIRVTATVLSENCGYQYDFGAPAASGTRCNASVRFTTRSGQVIRTAVTDAFPYEFSHRAGRPMTIQLRYDSSDPTQPFKQSNYMSVGDFLIVLGVGLVATALGIWWLVGAERLAERAVRLRMSQGPVVSDPPAWLGPVQRRIPIALAIMVLIPLIIYLVKS
jgi:hypothetical protein